MTVIDIGDENTLHECSICHNHYRGYGNNANPVSKGRCCNDCNTLHVIPARLRRTATMPALRVPGFRVPGFRVNVWVLFLEGTDSEYVWGVYATQEAAVAGRTRAVETSGRNENRFRIEGYKLEGLEGLSV